MVEPIQGEAGVVIPYDGYLKDIYYLCKKYNVLFITDEVQTGLGRTGYMMGYEHDLGTDLRPDITTLAKSISGGVSPVSGVLANAEIMDVIGPGQHGSTYGGNPFGMAVSKAAMRVLVEENMIENSMKMGGIFEERMRKIQSPVIKDYRCRGLFHAIEFHDHLPHDASKFVKILRDNGVLTKVSRGWIVRFLPPLIVNEE